VFGARRWPGCFDRNPAAAIIMTIDNPADEIFAYNVTQVDPPCRCR